MMPTWYKEVTGPDGVVGVEKFETVQDMLDHEETLSPIKKLEERQVAITAVGTWIVSTVFLMLDHNHSLTEPTPILYETMIFNKGPARADKDPYCERYATRAEAKAGHDWAVRQIRAGRHPHYIDEWPGIVHFSGKKDPNCLLSVTVEADLNCFATVVV